MKKIVPAFASLALLFGLVHAAQARILVNAQTTPAPASAAAVRKAHTLRLDAGKSLNAKRLKAEGVGVKPASRGVTRLANQLRKRAGGAKAATAGSTYWYTFQNYDNSWVDRFYTGGFYEYPYEYYVVYDNFKTCEYTGENCIDGNAFTYQYLVYYYPTEEWFWEYNTSDPNGGGWGPYVG
jgi:hypothetical protein